MLKENPHLFCAALLNITPMLLSLVNPDARDKGGFCTMLMPNIVQAIKGGNLGQVRRLIESGNESEGALLQRTPNSDNVSLGFMCLQYTNCGNP